MVYDNAFISMIPSFVRYAKCLNCKNKGKETAVVMMDMVKRGTPFEFKIGDMSLTLTCRSCRKTGRHSVHDAKDRDPENIKVVLRDPKTIAIETSPERGMHRYHMTIDPWLANKARQGDPFIIATTPWSMLEAISRNQKYRLAEEYFFHLRGSCPSGIKLYGWGLPKILTAFKDFFRLQILRKYDETLMMDYIVPMRMISPARGGSTSDGNSIMEMANMGNFRDALQGGIMRHRMDGADWLIMPTAVDYQAVGGEGTMLSPKDKITEEEDRLLNASIKRLDPGFHRLDPILEHQRLALTRRSLRWRRRGPSWTKGGAR